MPFPLALFIFFASGAAALLYQVVWQRMLSFFSGADVYSATIIVTAFMGGLGVGHLAGGHVADRVSRRASLLLFGVAEVAIAAFGAVSVALYYDLLYRRLADVALPPAVLVLVLFVSLLWPTALMGASLPLLARAMSDRFERVPGVVGRLYGVNTLGAAAGALLATWVLLPGRGLEGTLQVAILINVAAAACVVPLAIRPSRAADAAAPPRVAAAAPPGERPATGDVRAPIAFWLGAYGLAGFVALSLEIVWFRLLGVMLKSTAFTFGTLLAVYLGGLAAGALVGSRLVRRVREPGRTFLWLQASGGLSAVALLTLVVAVADDVGALRGYFASYEPLQVRDSVEALRGYAAALAGGPPPAASLPANFLRFYVGLPLLLVFIPTFLLGSSFPLLQRVTQRDLAHVGRRVGALLMANIAGSMLGAMLTGWFLLASIGTAGTVRLLAVLSLTFAVPAAWSSGMFGRSTAAIGVLAAGILIAAAPEPTLLWARLHGTVPDRILHAEDGSGVSVIRREHGGDVRAVVFVNGVGQSTLPYGGTHTALGLLPAFVHPQPRHALVIGLGSGDTTFAVAGRPGLERVTCVEIAGAQAPTLRALGAVDAYGGLRALLAHPAVEHVVGDGRIYLARAERRYDIIEADALRPTSAYSGNLYSEEYFALVKERLAPGGIAATWAPTQRVHNAFVRVFPYVVSVPGILLGSTGPIAVDRAAVLGRLEQQGVRAYYAAAGVDAVGLMAELLAQPVFYNPEFPRQQLTDINTDLFPRDEYDLGPR